MAKIDGTLVRYCASTSTKPFGPIFTPACSSPSPLRVRPEADRDQDLVALDGGLLAVHLGLHDERAALALEPLRLRVHVDGRAALPEPFWTSRTASGIDAGEDLRERLDEGHLRAELRVDRPELHPDDAAADADEPLRDLGEVERLLARSRRPCRRTRSPGISIGRAPVATMKAGASTRVFSPPDVHLDGVRPDEGGGPLHHLDAVPLLEEADAADHLLHHAVLELAQLRDVDLRLADQDPALRRRSGSRRPGSPRR